MGIAQQSEIWESGVLVDNMWGTFNFIVMRGALGRAVEHSTSDHWVTDWKTGVFISGDLSFFVSLLGCPAVRGSYDPGC